MSRLKSEVFVFIIEAPNSTSKCCFGLLIRIRIAVRSFASKFLFKATFLKSYSKVCLRVLFQSLVSGFLYDALFPIFSSNSSLKFVSDPLCKFSSEALFLTSYLNLKSKVSKTEYTVRRNSCYNETFYQWLAICKKLYKDKSGFVILVDYGNGRLLKNFVSY